ncbi:MAG: hypothetical protein HY826_12795 [Actinobacteria bacterium]|nr:hypothetical protein [Actinomycetota bacterium]
MLTRRIVLITTLILGGTACSAAGSSDDSAGTADATVTIGGLPPTLPTLGPGQGFTTIPRTTVPLLPEQLIGALVTGNRVIMIGDSVMAGTAKRYGGEMCAALVPLGWAVEVDAETARFIDFGSVVLNKRLGAGWDVAVVLLGNNYGGDPVVYRQYLERLLERLAPRPTVLLTVSEFEAEQLEVNAVIFEMATLHDNVVVVDWAAVTGAQPGLLRDDGLHLTDTGRAALAQNVAGVLGNAPTPPGKCLGTDFYDDSAGSVDGTTTTVSGDTSTPSTTNPGTTGPATTTTAPPATTTTTTTPAATTSTTSTTGGG